MPFLAIARHHLHSIFAPSETTFRRPIHKLYNLILGMNRLHCSLSLSIHLHLMQAIVSSLTYIFFGSCFAPYFTITTIYYEQYQSTKCLCLFRCIFINSFSLVIVLWKFMCYSFRYGFSTLFWFRRGSDEIDVRKYAKREKQKWWRNSERSKIQNKKTKLRRKTKLLKNVVVVVICNHSLRSNLNTSANWIDY